MSLFEEIKEIICEQLKAKPEEVKLETSFIDDLGADSLDSIELVCHSYLHCNKRGKVEQ